MSNYAQYTKLTLCKSQTLVKTKCSNLTKQNILLLSNCNQITVIKTMSNYTKYTRYTKLILYKSQTLLQTIKCSNLANHNRLYTIKLLLQSYTQTLQNILPKF